MYEAEMEVLLDYLKTLDEPQSVTEDITQLSLSKAIGTIIFNELMQHQTKDPRDILQTKIFEYIYKQHIYDEIELKKFYATAANVSNEMLLLLI